MKDSLKLQVRTAARGKPAGFDSAIAHVPGRWYTTLGGEKVFIAQLAGRDLRKLSERLASNIGEKLHHATWTVTSDPEEVRALGLMHDCASCRASVDQALAYLGEHPDDELVVGQLWWAQQ